MTEEIKQTKINEEVFSHEEEEWDWEQHPTWVEKNIDKTPGWISVNNNEFIVQRYIDGFNALIKRD